MKSTLKFALSIFISNIFSIILCGVIVVTLGGLYEYDAGIAIITAVTVFLSLCLPYSKAWQQGFKDKNYVQFGHMAEDRLRGLKAGLIAMIPSLAIAAAYFICKGIGGNVFIYGNIAVRVWFVPYLGIFSSLIDVFPLIALFILLPQPAAAMVGYRLGYRDFSISEKIIYKDQKKKRRPQK